MGYFSPALWIRNVLAGGQCKAAPINLQIDPELQGCIGVQGSARFRYLRSSRDKAPHTIDKPPKQQVAPVRSNRLPVPCNLLIA